MAKGNAKAAPSAVKLNNSNKKYYVYHLIDPRDGEPFYVGKGTGNRIFQHEMDAKKLRFANSEKEAVIHEIWDAGLTVSRRKIKHFDNENEAYLFEKEEIARIGIENLTNLAKGGEPGALKALRRGEKFIIELLKVIPMLSPNKAIEAKRLVNEMRENVNLCNKLLAEE